MTDAAHGANPPSIPMNKEFGICERANSCGFLQSITVAFSQRDLNSFAFKGFMPLLIMSLNVLLMPLFIATFTGK